MLHARHCWAETTSVLMCDCTSDVYQTNSVQASFPRLNLFGDSVSLRSLLHQVSAKLVTHNCILYWWQLMHLLFVIASY